MASVASCCLAAAAAAAAICFAFSCLSACCLACPPAEALYSGVHAGTSCMHLFGLDTKGSAVRGQTAARLPLACLLSLVRVPATSGVAFIGSQCLSPRKALAVPIPARTSSVRSPHPLCCHAYASAATISRRHTTEHARSEPNPVVRWILCLDPRAWPPCWPPRIYRLAINTPFSTL